MTLNTTISALLVVFVVFQFYPEGVNCNNGNEFVVAFVGYPTAKSASIALYVTNPGRINASVSISYRDSRTRKLRPRYTITVQPQRTKVQKIDNSFIISVRNSKAESVMSKGLLVRANRPVLVYGVYRDDPWRSEGFLGLPVVRTQRQGYTYIAVCHLPSKNTFSYVTVIAAKGSTAIVFKVKSTSRVLYGSRVYSSGRTIKAVARYSLDAFTLRSYGDLTGTEITTDKPVSVFAGASSAMIPSNVNCRGRLISQIPEVREWGRIFITQSFGLSTGYFVRIVAAFDGTNVKIDNNKLMKINKGSFIDRKATEVYCSKPCFVMQFWTNNCRTGAPFMTIIPPVSKYLSNYYLPNKVLPKSIYEFIAIIVETKDSSGILFDNRRRVVRWRAVGKSGYSVYKIRLSSASERAMKISHRSSRVRFYVSVYGYNKGVAYGFPGGWRLCNNKDPSVLDRIDNDCDGKIDEEVLNGKDDDNDGRIDEDYSAPLPRIIPPANTTTPLNACDKKDAVGRAGRARGEAGNRICTTKGGAPVITHRDRILEKRECQTTIARVWRITDGCKNSVEKTQLIKFLVPKPVISFPGKRSRRCGESIDPAVTGRPQIVKNTCSGNNVLIEIEDVISNSSALCPRSSQVLRRFTVNESCGRTWTAEQLIEMTPAEDVQTTKVPQQLKEKQKEADKHKKRLRDIGAGLGVVLGLAVLAILILVFMLIRRKRKRANGPPTIALPPLPPVQQHESLYQELNYPCSNNKPNNLAPPKINNNREVLNSDGTARYTPRQRKLIDDGGNRENASRHTAPNPYTYDDTVPAREAGQKGDHRNVKGEEGGKGRESAASNGLVNKGVEEEPITTESNMVNKLKKEKGQGEDEKERPEYLEIIKDDDGDGDNGSDDDGYEIPNERRENIITT